MAGSSQSCRHSATRRVAPREARADRPAFPQHTFGQRNRIVTFCGVRLVDGRNGSVYNFVYTVGD